MKAMTLALAAAALFLTACNSTPVSPTLAPTYQMSEPIEFSKMGFEIQSAWYTSVYRNWIGQETKAGDWFLIVDVEMVNKTSGPLPMHFQPAFQLADMRGTRYAAHAMHTMAINMNKPGRVSAGDVMNPNVRFKQQIVFEVPKQAYFLVVSVPSEARLGFGGSINSYGRYFLVDLKS